MSSFSICLMKISKELQWEVSCLNAGFIAAVENNVLSVNELGLDLLDFIFLIPEFTLAISPKFVLIFDS